MKRCKSRGNSGKTEAIGILQKKNMQQKQDGWKENRVKSKEEQVVE